jgi:hypothetical protein
MFRFHGYVLIIYAVLRSTQNKKKSVVLSPLANYTDLLLVM